MGRGEALSPTPQPKSRAGPLRTRGGTCLPSGVATRGQGFRRASLRQSGLAEPARGLDGGHWCCPSDRAAPSPDPFSPSPPAFLLSLLLSGRPSSTLLCGPSSASFPVLRPPSTFLLLRLPASAREPLSSVVSPTSARTPPRSLPLLAPPLRRCRRRRRRRRPRARGGWPAHGAPQGRRRRRAAPRMGRRGAPRPRPPELADPAGHAAGARRRRDPRAPVVPREGSVPGDVGRRPARARHHVGGAAAGGRGWATPTATPAPRGARSRPSPPPRRPGESARPPRRTPGPLRPAPPDARALDSNKGLTFLGPERGSVAARGWGHASSSPTAGSRKGGAVRRREPRTPGPAPLPQGRPSFKVVPRGPAFPEKEEPHQECTGSGLQDPSLRLDLANAVKADPETTCE